MMQMIYLLEQDGDRAANFCRVMMTYRGVTLQFFSVAWFLFLPVMLKLSPCIPSASAANTHRCFRHQWNNLENNTGKEDPHSQSTLHGITS